MDYRELSPGWYEGREGPHKWQAQVFDQGSRYGIDGGRVSRLNIIEADSKRLVYRWDRGQGIDQAPEGLVGRIVALFPRPANDITTLDEAIRESILQDRTVKAEVPDLALVYADIFQVRPDDEMDYSVVDGVMDFWGETPEGDTWRLRITEARL